MKELISDHLRRAYAHLTGMSHTDMGVYFQRGGFMLYADVEFQPQHPENPLFRVIKDRNNVVLVRAALNSDTSWTTLADHAVSSLTTY